ncbi:hypothetical protein Taro_042969 [Colocasia esculenta]|uniref:Uncharacterized protein n=1 Tax=Colocasia esculenta TaxID=4460 RepID=A0A843WJR6_COLES|nr:hypothetical protein [Colocasia esculenta]
MFHISESPRCTPLDYSVWCFTEVFFFLLGTWHRHVFVYPSQSPSADLLIEGNAEVGCVDSLMIYFIFSSNSRRRPTLRRMLGTTQSCFPATRRCRRCAFVNETETGEGDYFKRSPLKSSSWQESASMEDVIRMPCDVHENGFEEPHALISPKNAS